MLWVYLGLLLAIVAGFIAVGAGVYRRNRKRGALVGLIAGVVIGRLINNALFFNAARRTSPPRSSTRGIRARGPSPCRDPDGGLNALIESVAIG